MSAPASSVLPALCSVVVPLCPAVAGAAGSVAGHVAGDVASSVVGDVLHAFVSGIDSAVRDALTGLGKLLSPEPQVGSKWFHVDVAAMGAVAETVQLPLLLVATIGAVIRQDPGRLARIWLVALPMSALFAVVAAPLVATALGASDGLTHVLVGQADTAQKVQSLIDTLVPPLTSIGAGALAVMVGAALLLVTLVLSLELVLRNSAIYLTVLFLPLVFAAAVWPPMMVGVKRALEVLATLVLSKFVIVATLVLGVSTLTSGGGAETILVGLGILMLAAFAPFAVLRLMPIVEAGAIGHLEGRARQPVQAMRGGAHSARASLPAAMGLLGVDAPAAGSEHGAGAGGAVGNGPGAAGSSGAAVATQVAGMAATTAERSVEQVGAGVSPPQGSATTDAGGGDDRFPWGPGFPPLADGDPDDSVEPS